MAAKEAKQESIIIKIYLILLFFCGIGLWLVLQPASKHTLSVDVEVDNMITDVLSAETARQEILSQYVRERKTRKAQWNEFYKRIRLKGNLNSSDYEERFRKIARLLKIGLSRTDNADASVTYKFYSRDGKTYSNVTFINPKKSLKSGAAK
ncbi:MAG: hypothetical protein LBQ47_06805 [Endomicrobium sp.]|jgi:predicted membrane metal-binding protein|nr:hypothetical protein [Endomicrobium sp.]